MTYMKQDLFEVFQPLFLYQNTQNSFGFQGETTLIYPNLLIRLLRHLVLKLPSTNSEEAFKPNIFCSSKCKVLLIYTVCNNLTSVDIRTKDNTNRYLSKVTNSQMHYILFCYILHLTLSVQHLGDCY